MVISMLVYKLVHVWEHKLSALAVEFAVGLVSLSVLLSVGSESVNHDHTSKEKHGINEKIFLKVFRNGALANT